MMLKALIVEQLDADGILRTFRMQPSNSGRDIVVAFADEYEEPRYGPVHFLDEEDAGALRKASRDAVSGRQKVIDRAPSAEPAHKQGSPQGPRLQERSDEGGKGACALVGRGLLRD
jgi:hypothetical protein